LLPLFQEEAASAAMICHAIDVITKAMNVLNQGQVPVLACDQPLYAIGKKIQWNFPTVYGEKKLVVMFGGFHTELAALKALGSWIEDSGWTSVLVQAGVITPGTADSFLKASHVSRTRHAHQVTAAALYVLMDKAYNTYREGVDEGEEPKSFSDWRKQAELKSTISLLVAYASPSAHHSDIRPVVERREISTSQGCLPITRAVVCCFRSHPLREIAASSYSRYGMS